MRLSASAAQTVLFAVALVGEWLSIYLTSRHGAWRIHSVSHWTERYGLFVIIAIGESIVAIGSGASDSALTSGLLVASLLGVTAAICLWWLYFDVVAIVAEEEMSRADDARRLAIALEGYTYGHYLLVSGILLAAAGVELALEHEVDGEALGLFASVMLLGGLALHLAGHVWFKARVFHTLNRGQRVGAAVVLLVAIPVVQHLEAIPALAVPTTVLAVVVVLDTRHHTA